MKSLLDRILGRIDPDDYFQCPNKNCKERGDYLMCIYDKFPNCEEYRKYERKTRTN